MNTSQEIATAIEKTRRTDGHWYTVVAEEHVLDIRCNAVDLAKIVFIDEQDLRGELDMVVSDILFEVEKD
jgi:hypothetical protein